jgi:hypothetical protein
VPPAVLEFAGDDHFAGRALATLFHAAPSTTREPTHRYRAQRGDDGYYAVARARPLFGPAHLAEVCAFLEWCAVEDLLAGVTGEEVFVHAAGVRLGDTFVLLIGSSGTGKSTLAAHLLLRGHLVWGDDLVRFAPADNPFSSVPRSFKLDYKSLSGLPLVAQLCREGRTGTLLAPSCGYVSPAAIRSTWAAPSGRASAVVALELGDPGEPPKLTRTSEALGALGVIESLIGAADMASERRGRLTVAVMDSLADVMAYRARSGSAEALALLLERELAA